MLKDITAILIHYKDQAVLNKALTSLEKITSRLKSIIVLQERENPLRHEYNWSAPIQYIPIEGNDVGETMNHTIDRINSSYVLFLQETDYLSPTIHVDSLQLSEPTAVLGTSYHNQNIVIHHPLLVRTSFLKKQPFLSNRQLPFNEALFPAWLSDVENSIISFKEDLVRRTRKNTSTTTLEKQKVLQKYQFEKTNTNHPSLSVVISTYNMEKYVETAVVSCFLQNEQLDQILIMDDGSTDNSYRRLKCWDDGKHVMAFTKHNGGKARALNALLPHVTSEFVLELDADDWLDSDAVSVIKKQLSQLPEDVSVLYGNLRKWKQLTEDVLFKRVAKGTHVRGKDDLLSYRFPLGPRIYRTSSLKSEGGFPVIPFENGRMYEDVSVLNRLIKNFRFQYHDFSVYNVREHKESITKSNLSNWNDFIKTLK
ncbi:glycosyltransferase family 2 protein [Virgibacillus salidurans]|uniref:glycosyltransferase family 2 protein n=1 Tax=Virgibacillus salidurans TaxID=2831673 RepID=UPI001F247F56|nr:glycosyltransferase family A protein [Virgibacillus sp. NKC19-16]